jgi:integrase
MLLDRKGNRKYLTKTERWAFFEAIESGGLNLESRTFCLVLFYSGCRISEALNLTFRQVDWSDRALIFETLKRRRKGHFRQVPIPGVLVDLLKELADERDTSSPIWGFSRSTGYRCVKDLMAAAKITGKQASPKGLRHAFAIACVSAAIPISTVQRWLGHADLKTTSIYLNFVGEEEREQASRTWPK